MITIPATVKTLLKTDGTKKALRITFPNGEYLPIKNDQIVTESMSFTESVCSSDVLRFGLAEAPCLQFEAVNIANIYGLTIKAYIDVYYPNNTFYAIPLGVFTVTDCPRSAGAMYRRKVTAYGYGGAQLKASSFATRRINYPTFTTPLTFNLFNYVVSASGQDFGLVDSGTSMTGTTGTVPLGISAPSWTHDGHSYTTTISGYSGKLFDTAQLSMNLWRFTQTYSSTALNAMLAEMEEYGAGSAQLKAARCIAAPAYEFAYAGSSRQTYPFDDPADSGYFFGCNGADTYVYIPNGVTITLKEDGTTINTYTFSGMAADLVAKNYGTTDTNLLKLSASVEPSFQNDTGTYMYLGAVDFPALYEGFLELLAAFGTVDRDGIIKFVRLSKASPVSVATSELYEDGLLFDEYDVEEIGTVRVTYHDPDFEEDQTIDYVFGSGASSYSMTENAFLKALSVKASDVGGDLQAFIETLLDTYFVPNVGDIAFTPVDLTMIGLPYLEPGDYLEIDAGNGVTVGTYIMSRTLNGIQVLSDDIQSQGGEIEDAES